MFKIRFFIILSLFIYLVMMCYIVVIYLKLLIKVFIYYNLVGDVDNFVDKWVLFLINSVFIVIWFIFFIVGRYYE